MAARSMADEARSLANALAGEPEPPKAAKLADDERVYWGVIMRARARDEWAELDLYVAAELARSMADQERIRSRLAALGDTVANARGTVVATPDHHLLEVVTRRILALRKDLLIHSAALAPGGGDAIQVRPKREEEARAREALAKADADDDGDDLLAAPLRH